MKARLNQVRMCQACGQWYTNCEEYQGEILCPACKQFEVDHRKEREEEESLLGDRNAFN